MVITHVGCLVDRKIKSKAREMYKIQMFNECMGSMLNHELVLELDKIEHHMVTTRLQHSLRVSYLSFCIASRFGFDATSAARGGLLHDLFFFKRADKKHNSLHPVEALKNADMLFELNDKERDAISSHMWPLTPAMPKYTESLVVSLADKVVTGYEAYKHISEISRKVFTYNY